MGAPPEHTWLGKAVRAGSWTGTAVQAHDQVKAQEAAYEEDIEARRRQFGKRPDLTDLVVKANRNLQALKGRSVLGVNAGLSSALGK